MPDHPSSAEAITRASQSNLAFAFISLGKERRRDITIFYAYCRLIDDIADSTEMPSAEKARRLKIWRDALQGPVAPEPSLAAEVRGLTARYAITPAMLEEIMDGVEMDLTIARYETFADLRLYCYRVASAVGLVSIEIFGYQNPVCREYAIELGLALQVTNILRDVAKDFANGRVYLPAEDMARFDYRDEDLAAHRDDERFVRLMQFEAERAQAYFRKADALLPREDRRSMIGARIMGSIYHALLHKMERDRFRVFQRDYRIGKPAKLWLAFRQLLPPR
ncbi:MAG: squalene/phytoene synthase family protein [Verrucomicrobiota bacterium]|nr:squalene/phytoene synthase family protein [Chthoniobacterales bacterium]MDQ3413946.1 squalene/phytoene synthase family protein [Verrucomicrobiota bacterium]